MHECAVQLISVCVGVLVAASQSGFMLEAVGGTVLASRVALERGWAINLGGGFHHASASSGARGKHTTPSTMALLSMTRH
jgi:hypothetical protein